jgi:hypothetical protein
VNFTGPAVTKCRVPSATVVEPLNVGTDITFRVCLSCVEGAVNAFVHQCGEKRFGQCVIPTHTGSPHRRPHTQPGDQRSVAFCGVDGEFKRSMQHRVVEVTVVARRTPRLGSSSPALCAAGYSVKERRLRGRPRSIPRGRCLSASTGGASGVVTRKSDT